MANCTITIDGAEVIIDEFRILNFSRETDNKGRPSSSQGPLVAVCTRNPLFDKKVFLQKYSDKVSFNATVKLKEEIEKETESITIEFKNAYVIQLSLEFVESSSSPITETVQLTTEEVEIEGVPWKWPWPQV